MTYDLFCLVLIIILSIKSIAYAFLNPQWKKSVGGVYRHSRDLRLSTFLLPDYNHPLSWFIRGGHRTRFREP